ncbi:hypothetical protein Tco_0814612, partial [Tanacetum coccineum]
TVPDLQDLERNIQLVDTGLPSTLDEGTRKSQPLPKGTTTGPKDSGGNDQPADKGLPSMASNEGTDKTTPRPEGPLGDKDSWGHKTPVDIEPIHPTIIDPSGTDVRAFSLSNDEAQESEEAIFGAGDEVDEDSQHAAVQHQSSPPQADKPQSSTASYTKASDSDSSSDDLLKKYDNILPLTKRQLVKYLRKASSVLFNRVTEDHWDKHKETAVHYANLKASIDEYFDENIAHED